MDLEESNAHVLRHFIDEKTVDAKIGSWIPHPRFYQDCATMYTKVVDV